MSATRGDRLEAYLATRRSSSLRDAIKRRVGNWPLYAHHRLNHGDGYQRLGSGY